MAPSPKLSILIVSHNSAQFLRECLGSITAQSTAFPFEILLVDNASSDGTADLIQHEFPEVVYHPNDHNVGFAAANNQAHASSRGEYLLVLNPDTVLHQGALQSMFEFMEGHDDIGVVGPTILNGDGTLQRTGVSEPSIWNLLVETFFLDLLFSHSRVFGKHRRLYDDPRLTHDVDYLQGSCLLIRGKALGGGSLFDEGYFLYFEETDLCTRIRRTGWRVTYFPGAQITHYGGGGTTYYDRTRLVLYHRSFLRYLHKHVPPLPRISFRLVLIIRSTVRRLLFLLLRFLRPARRDEWIDRGSGYTEVLLLLAGFKR